MRCDSCMRVRDRYAVNHAARSACRTTKLAPGAMSDEAKSTQPETIRHHFVQVIPSRRRWAHLTANKFSMNSFQTTLTPNPEE